MLFAITRSYHDSTIMLPHVPALSNPNDIKRFSRIRSINIFDQTVHGRRRSGVEITRERGGTVL